MPKYIEDKNRWDRDEQAHKLFLYFRLLGYAFKISDLEYRYYSIDSVGVVQTIRESATDQKI